jgi:hypothetical protein
MQNLKDRERKIHEEISRIMENKLREIQTAIDNKRKEINKARSLCPDIYTQCHTCEGYYLPDNISEDSNYGITEILCDSCFSKRYYWR